MRTGRLPRQFNDRIQHKGTSETDEHLKLVCEIRHNHTRYEKLAVFYSIRPKYRTQLNTEINKLIKKGPDGVPEFRKNIKKLENKVNLNNKNTRKQFIKEEIQRLRNYFTYATEDTLKKCAEQLAIDCIRANNEYIHKHKILNDPEP